MNDRDKTPEPLAPCGLHDPDPSVDEAAIRQRDIAFLGLATTSNPQFWQAGWDRHSVIDLLDAARAHPPAPLSVDVMVRAIEQAGDAEGWPNINTHTIRRYWAPAILRALATPEPGLTEALDRYALHSLDGHDECAPDCEIAAVRLALPNEAYAAAISHGDVAAALASPEDLDPTTEDGGVG